MIDIKAFREQPQFFRDAAKNKGVEIDAERILELDRRVRLLKTELEQIRAQKNEVSKRMPTATPEERQALIAEMRGVDGRADVLTAELNPIDAELEELLYRIPNPSLVDVKVGKDDSENEVVRKVGTPREFGFTPKDHLEVAEGLGIIDAERAAKVSGARFYYTVGDGVMLELALQRYALEILMAEGFVPLLTPHLVSAKVMRAMGYLEHGGHDEIYYLAKDNLYLIGTAEQSAGAIHMDEIINVDQPIRYVGMSPSYRREAGSYGKDTRGIIRVHQFDKIEMFSFVKPEASDAEHEFLLSLEEKLMQGLGLPYQVIKQCTGDLGMPAARKFDIETWIPTQKTYRETHSTSTCTDYQARRLNTRYRTGDGTAFVHTLNGTAFAIGRTMAAILENYQEEDGSVRIPDVLLPYMGKSVLTPKT